jgi:hypothetical protein
MGVGRALVTEAVSAAADLGFTEIWLQTEPDTMTAAHRLYREAGFADIPAYHDLGVAGVATLGMQLARSGGGRRSGGVAEMFSPPGAGPGRDTRDWRQPC